MLLSNESHLHKDTGMEHLVSDMSTKEKICLLVPTNHLNGALMMELKYTFGREGFSNSVSSIKITPWLQKQDSAAGNVYLATTEVILDGMKQSLDYFAYVADHLKERKSHPRSFAQFIRAVA